MSSHKFAEQIKKLEEEGAKLLAATHNLGDSLHIPDKYSRKGGAANTSGLDLSSLTDITAEQKTISDLRLQLDTQCRETERLQREMFNNSASSVPREPALPSTLTGLEIPLTHTLPPVSAALGTRKQRSLTSDYQAQLSDRQLKDAQSEIKELRSRLKEAIGISEQQKAHFRSTIEDLRKQLQSAVSGHESLLTKSKREINEKDSMLSRLQETVEQLERANKLQEETLLEMNDRLEHFQKDKYIIDTAVGQIRDLLVGREHKRGRVFYENEPISKQSITMLVHSIERAFHDVDFDVNQRQDKIDQLILELDDIKLKQDRKEDQIILDYERKMSKQREDLSLELASLTEQATASKERSALLQDKNAMLEKQLDQEVRTREEQIADLEGKVKLLRHEHGIDHSAWADKKAALELALDETQKELALMRGDKDASIRRAAQVESRFTDMQMAIDKLTADLASEQDKARSLMEAEVKANATAERLQLQLKHKDQVLADLEQKFSVVKQEADAHIQTAINSMEKEGKAFIEKEMSSLKTQLQVMTEKCHALELELQVTKSEHGHLKEKFSETKSNLDKRNAELEQANSKQQSLTAMVSDKVTETERMLKEKEHYQQLYDERGNEVNTLKALREKLTIQLEEREKNFLQLQQQNERMAEVAQSSSRHHSDFKAERDVLQQKFNEKIIETEELRKMRDVTAKKLRIREKKLQEVEAEQKALAEELGEKRAEAGAMEREKEKLYEELKHSRYEVATLQEEKAKLEKQLQQNEGALNKEISKMNKRLKSSEHDLKLTKKVLKSKEQVDKKAVKVAGDMQKEVTAKRGQIDTLQTRMRWLEECLDAALKDKKCLQEESDSLAETLEDRRQHSDKLTQELKNSLNKCDEYKQKVSKLEGALEKAALKNGQLETQLEEQQQQNVRLKLKHQLEVKELQRHNKSRHHNSTDRMKMSSPASTGALTSCSSAPSAAYNGAPSTAYTAAPSIAYTGAPSTTYTAAPSIAYTGAPSTAYTGAPSTAYTRPVTSSYSPAFTQMTECEEQPVRDTATKVQEKRGLDEKEVSAELRALMQEMRSVLQNQAQHTARAAHGESSVFSDSELEPRLVRRGSARGRRDKRRSQRGLHSRQGERPVSPVSDLLLTFDEIQSDSCLLSGNDSYEESPDAPHYKSYTDISPMGLRRTAGVVPAAQDVCKRLEKKIENLSKMGSHLQSEHQEMARVMQDQERKLQKVKSQMR